jgi:hypothetical protein
MATNTSWLQRIPSLPQAKPIATPKQSTTFTSLRTGQFPHHPRAQKVPKPERPPNFGDSGDLGNEMWWNNPSARKATPEQRAPEYSDQGTSTLPLLTRDNLPDSMLFPGMEGSPDIPPEMEPDDAPEAEVRAPSDVVGKWNEDKAKSPYAPIPPFVPKDAQGNPVTPDSLSSQIAQFPQNNPPKWWQRAIAAGVGAGEGVANAGGHMRHPIDIGASVNAIENPGYANKLEAWRSRVVPQELQLQLASQIRKAQMDQAKAQSEAEYKQAAAGMMGGRQKYYEALATGRQTIPANDAVVAATKGMIPKGTPLTAAEIDTVLKLPQGTTAKNTVLQPGAQMVDQTGKVLATNTNQRPGAAPRPIVTSPQQIVFDPVTGKEIARNTNNRQFAPRAAGRGTAPQQVSEDIENRKQQRLAAAEQQFILDHDEAKLATNKARAQNQYEQEIIRHHGTVAPQGQQQQGASASSGRSTGTGAYAVTAPDGSTHRFATPQQAKQFSDLIGVK